jgi:arylsulfatase A-like enzyme
VCSSDLQIPLIVTAPGIKGGQRRTGLAESIDLYPSLCELAGLPLPAHLQGLSFAKLMKNPQADWKTAAVGRFKYGDTIRTDAFRFTEYTDAKGRLQSTMLYDHSTDPRENENVVRGNDVAERLAEKLRRTKGRD